MDDNVPAIERLLGIMAALRTPGSGCPWDLEQTFATIAPYTVEEAYEVADAIERGDFEDLKDELGDLLLQVVYHARIAEEQDRFRFDDVVEAISQKMVRRHPHVFGGRHASDAAAVDALWAEIKDQEKAETRRLPGASPRTPDGALGHIPLALPALVRADKIGRRAARTGFDWTSASEVLAKVREEVAEVEEALAEQDEDAVREEIGDLLFAVANLARYVNVDSEDALRRANAKFARRFRSMEASVAGAGQSLGDLGPAEFDALWRRAKAGERGGSEDGQP